MYGWNLEPNWTRKKGVRGIKAAGKTRAQSKTTLLNRKTCSAAGTDRHEAAVQVGGVEEGARLPGLLQDRQHHLVPQGPVKPDDLLDVAEQLGRLHLRQQAALLQVQQPTQEQLRVHPNTNRCLTTGAPRVCLVVAVQFEPLTYVSDDSQFLYVCGFGVQKLPYRLLLVELPPGQSLQEEQVGSQNRSWECLKMSNDSRPRGAARPNVIMRDFIGGCIHLLTEPSY